MNNLWLKIRIWTKIILLALVVIYVFVFMLQNSGQQVNVWLFPKRQYNDVSVLVLIFLSFGIGVVGTLLVWMALRTMRQVREMRQRQTSQRLEREVADMKLKAARLQTRPEAAETEPPMEGD